MIVLSSVMQEGIKSNSSHCSDLCGWVNVESTFSIVQCSGITYPSLE